MRRQTRYPFLLTGMRGPTRAWVPKCYVCDSYCNPPHQGPWLPGDDPVEIAHRHHQGKD